MSEKKAADSGTLAVIRDWAVEKFASAPVATTVTIATSDWSNNSCTKTVTGMTSSLVVIVSPAPASMDAYSEAGVKATAQGTNSLTFECDDTPSEILSVNILMISATVVEGVTLSSLTVSGEWTNTQYVDYAPDITGLSFTATFSDGTTSSVSPSNISVSPSIWSDNGAQTATFSYTYNGVTRTTTKTAVVQVRPAGGGSND